ncbi:MAG: hypothetical protein ACJ72N_21990 [Labedaea sp.]
MRQFDVEEPEAAWLEGWSMDRQAELITRAQEGGISDALAYGVAGWLTALHHALPLFAGNPREKKRRYRRVLLEIGPPAKPRKGPSEGRGATKRAAGPKARRLAGGASTATLVALATPIIFDDVDSPAPATVATLPALGNLPVSGKVPDEVAA